MRTSVNEVVWLLLRVPMIWSMRPLTPDKLCPAGLAAANDSPEWMEVRRLTMAVVLELFFAAAPPLLLTLGCPLSVGSLFAGREGQPHPNAPPGDTPLRPPDTPLLSLLFLLFRCLRGDTPGRPEEIGPPLMPLRGDTPVPALLGRSLLEKLDTPLLCLLLLLFLGLGEGTPVPVPLVCPTVVWIPDVPWLLNGLAGRPDLP